MHDMHHGLLGVSGQGVSLGSAQNATARWEEIDMKDPAGEIYGSDEHGTARTRLRSIRSLVSPPQFRVLRTVAPKFGVSPRGRPPPARFPSTNIEPEMCNVKMGLTSAQRKREWLLRFVPSMKLRSVSRVHGGRMQNLEFSVADLFVVSE